MLKLSQRHELKQDMKDKAKSDLKHIIPALKKEPIVKEMFKKYKRDINDIDNISIQFAPLDVSAKTINGDIFLNEEMLKDNWKDYFQYLPHELIHHLQHTSGKCAEDQKDEPYLDQPAEIEAFKAQLQYKEKTEDAATVNRYLRDLFDKHEIPKDERKEKKEELLGEK